MYVAIQLAANKIVKNTNSEIDATPTPPTTTGSGKTME